LLAGFVALGLALVADYLDPSFHTPDEVKEFLNIPVFVSIPDNGHHVPVEKVAKNGY
jgi:capsular polysaccharide biosynthesis protein